MSPTPLVSVVVVNWNGAAVIGRCLVHLAAQRHPAVECIVVDNGSTDDSVARIEAARAELPLTLVRSPINRGIAAGRNLGIARARGAAVAFIDNDGYAHPDWLSHAVAALEADPDLGAVAPLVLFADRTLLLNGAGGTLNRRGYARDHCFAEPHEFAALPDAVLYPMGCGMVVRRQALAAIGPLDEALMNYYDDVEVGIRLWARGWRVAVCRDARVDHDARGAGEHGSPARLLLGERHRIRTVLKYFPARHLLPWLARESLLAEHLRHDGRRQVPLAGWSWNLRHLGSARHIRRQFAGAAARFWPLLDPAWRLREPACATNRSFRPRPEACTATLRLDGTADAVHLNFGWHAPAHAAGRVHRRTAGVASAYVRLTAPVTTCIVLWRADPPPDAVALALRPAAGGPPVWQELVPPPPRAWEHRRLPARVAPGTYELLVHTRPIRHDAAGREHGIDVAAIAFTAER